MTESRRREDGGYWVLRGASGSFYTCVRFGDLQYTALCVFDSREAAREHAGSLDENQIFLGTLEMYGRHLPPWARRGPLVPGLRRVSDRELWEIIKTLGVGYVTLNPPTPGRDDTTFELRPSHVFETT